jgi:hypothetical protein
MGRQISKLHAGFEPCETRWPWAGAGSTPASSGPSAEPGVDQALGNGVIRHCPRPFPSGPPPRPQTRLDVPQTLVVSQLREGHRQVLAPARETSPVSITAITGHLLLKLVGGQVVHELSKNGLAGIHPSLSAIGQGARRGGFSPARSEKFKSKNRILLLPHRFNSSYRLLKNFSRTAVAQDRLALVGSSPSRNQI